MAIRSLATLLILVSIAALALAKTKCLEMPVQEIEIGKVTASIRGGTLDLVLNTVAGVEIPGIHWAVDSLVERQRTRILDELGNRVPQCVAPRVNPYDWLQDIGNPHYLNPVEPPSASACTGWNTGSGAAEAIPTCGEILGAYTVSEMECESSHLTTRLGGVDFELVRINMTLPGVDNFLLAVTYFIAGEDANFDFSGITNYSRAVTYLYVPIAVFNYPCRIAMWILNILTYISFPLDRNIPITAPTKSKSPTKSSITPSKIRPPCQTRAITVANS